jgi:hypothetical protein
MSQTSCCSAERKRRRERFAPFSNWHVRTARIERTPRVDREPHAAEEAVGPVLKKHLAIVGAHVDGRAVLRIFGDGYADLIVAVGDGLCGSRFDRALHCKTGAVTDNLPHPVVGMKEARRDDERRQKAIDLRHTGRRWVEAVQPFLELLRVRARRFRALVESDLDASCGELHAAVGRWFPVPRQLIELVALDGARDDALEHIVTPGMGIRPVQLRSMQQ